MLVDALLSSARRHPGKLAAQDPTRRLTYAQFLTLAQAMRRLVLQETRGERVGVMLPGSVAGLGALFGVLWAERTAVPLNFLLPPRELANVIDDAGIDLVLTTTHFRKQFEATKARALYLEEIGLKRRFFWEKLRRTPAAPAGRPDDVAVILYTSGTTGQPKGVCLTHKNLFTNAAAAIEHLRIVPEANLLGIIPPFHIFGLNMLVFLPVILGCTVTYIPRFSPQATLKAVETEGITVLIAVPSMYAAIARLKRITPDAFKRITIAASGGEPLPRAVHNLMRERTGLTLIEGYGLTETSPIISADLPWAPRVGTVGPPLPDVEIQVRDEAGNPLPTGQEGELHVRGPLVMKGYYQRPEETAAVIDADGWFRTGDIVRVDDDGRISITGRAKDLIIVGGENVYPREVESVIEQHPAVAECAVIGKNDGSRGEVVVGFVILKEGKATAPNELRGFCRDRLAGFKTPRQIHISDELPRGPTGKILKRELKSLLPG